MGRRGPVQTPTEILKARGSHRAGRNTHEPQDDVVAPTAPDWLDEEGRAEWRRLVPLLKQRRTISKAARGVLATLCQNWSLFVRASRQLNLLLADEQAEAMAIRRWTVVANEACHNYLKAAAEFGLSPAAKARVKADPAAPATDEGKGRFFRAG